MPSCFSKGLCQFLLVGIYSIVKASLYWPLVKFPIFLLTFKLSASLDLCITGSAGNSIRQLWGTRSFSHISQSLEGKGVPFGPKVFPIFLSHRLPVALCQPPYMVENVRGYALEPKIIAVENPLEWIIKSKPELVGFLCLTWSLFHYASFYKTLLNKK